MMEKEILYMYASRRGKYGFGPVQHLPILENGKEGLEIKPLTVFIGGQGTGKSLFSQIVYFFRNLPYLVRYQSARPGQKSKDPEILIRQVMDNLRSDQRALGVFANPRVTFKWQENTINMQFKNRRIGANKKLRSEIANPLSQESVFHQKGQAIFIPAERVLYSQGSQAGWDLLSLPSTLIHFASIMGDVGRTYQNWINGISETIEGRKIRAMGIEMLGGEVARRSGDWKWKVGEIQFDIDMASSGQKANWPLVLLAQALFEWHEQGLIGKPFSIHIEEPEIHLHPAAQVQMMKLVTFLVNHDFKILLTTHSPTTLYTLNNLMTASTLLGDKEIPDVPEKEYRISPEKVAAYLFAGADVKSIITKEKIGLKAGQDVTWLDENKLRKIDKDLGKELSRIRYYGSLTEDE